MTRLFETSQQPDPETTKLRVLLLLQVREGATGLLLDAYERIRHQVSSVPGHLQDQLCQSIDDNTQWLITSEWEAPRPFLDWVNSPEHREVVKPLHDCVEANRSLRFAVVRATPRSRPSPAAAATSTGRARRAPVVDGISRHAITFTVKPGSEQAASEILAGYAPPRADVDATTRLHRTSVFMRGNRIVRAIEIHGDTGAALRHIAAQPEIRACEAALNPHLAQERDLTSPEKAQAFFARAALPVVFHMTARHRQAEQRRRRALLYPVRNGCGAVVAQLLARHDEQLAAARSAPLARSTIFLRDDVLVRVIDTHEPLLEQPAAAAGVGHGPAATELAGLLELGPDAELTTDDGLWRFLANCDMALVTDRQAAPR